jgi:hypothetical protein
MDIHPFSVLTPSLGVSTPTLNPRCANVRYQALDPGPRPTRDGTPVCQRQPRSEDTLTHINTVRVSPDPFLRARGMTNSLLHGVSSRLATPSSRLRALEATPEPRSFGRCVAEPLPHHLAPPLARFPTGTGGCGLPCRRVGGHAARKLNVNVAILCTRLTHHAPT